VIRPGTGRGLPRSARRSAALALSLALLGAAAPTDAPDSASGADELAAGRFLVAADKVHGAYFQKSVVFLLSYGESGALGLIVNHPTDVALHDVVQGAVDGAGQVYLGGPVERASVMVLFRAKSAPERAIRVTGDVFMTVDPAILLERTGKPGGAGDVRVYAGYTGWGPGQLEGELARGDWIVASEALEPVIFADAPDALWKKLHLRHHRLKV
jgi:putative transcriptional regulator